MVMNFDKKLFRFLFLKSLFIHALDVLEGIEASSVFYFQSIEFFWMTLNQEKELETLKQCD